MKFACFDIPTLPLGAFSPRAGGGMRLHKGDPVSDAVDTVGDIGQGAVDVVSDAGSAIDDAIVQPVVKAVDNTVQAALDDPVKAAAIAAAIATGQPELIPYIEGADAVAEGASPEDVLARAGKAYVMQQAAGAVSSEVSPEYGRTAGNAAGSAAVAAATGGDPLQAAVNSGMNAGINAGINAGVDAWNTSSTPDTFEPMTVDPDTGNITYRYDDGSTLTTDSEGNPIGSTDYTAMGTTSNFRLPSANFFPSAAAGVRGVLGATGTTGTAGTTGTTGTVDPMAANSSTDPLSVATGNRPGASDSSTLNPLLFSLAGFQPPKKQSMKDPFSDLSLGTSGFAPSNDSSNANPFAELSLGSSYNAPAPTPTQQEEPQSFAEGGLASVHPMGEPEFYSEGGLNNRYIKGEGDGTSDSIPAMVADSEFVMPADVVAALGNGSSDAGASKLDQMVQQIRKRARSTGPSELPPTAHESPLDYLKGRA
jgi:hypothetical protein